jgi:hypothetical protein
MTEDEYMSLSVGDEVVCNTTSHSWEENPSYTKGSVYVLRAPPKINTSIMTTYDDNGSKTNGWSHKFFDIICSGKTYEDCL